ncbi:hypothetical protein E3C22_14455 [Jiella endophytica]|uniref:DUF2384 domain-containing protein n=1 Tax=Jiella endophytica TaxID=2558362 RepID=A0A4Y8RJ44_9HYPH|nr:hypothetical protein [Jiella endophytica]TFF21867.1 hypothetical protein E3C22_14455 [Jiella endophytica]
MQRADLVAAGGTYDLSEVRELFGAISRQAIDKKARDGSLLAVPGPGNSRRYPTLQFSDDGSLVQGLRQVRAALPTTDPWAVLNFLVNPDPRLGGRAPIALLHGGEVAIVVEAAKRMGEQGA